MMFDFFYTCTAALIIKVIIFSVTFRLIDQYEIAWQFALKFLRGNLKALAT